MKRIQIASAILLTATLVSTQVQANVPAQCSAKVVQGAVDGMDMTKEQLLAMLGLVAIPFVPYTDAEVRQWVADAQAAESVPRMIIDLKVVDDPNDDLIIFRDYVMKNGVSTLEVMAEKPLKPWLDDLNNMEQTINEYGFSFRKDATDSVLYQAIWQVYTDPDKLRRQLLEEIKLKATEQLKACVDAIPVAGCPRLDIISVEQQFKVKRTEKVTFPSGDQMTVEDLVWAVNNTAKIGCAIGFSIYQLLQEKGYTLDSITKEVRPPSNSSPGTFPSIPSISMPQFVRDWEEALRNMLPRLGLPDKNLFKFLNEKSKGLNELTDFFDKYDLPWFSDKNDGTPSLFKFPKGSWYDFPKGSWFSGPDGTDNGSWYKFKMDSEGPAEMVKKLKDNIQLAESTIKKIPNIPTVEPPQYPELEITKNKEWPGFNVGNKSIVAASSNAYLRLYGGEKAQAAVAYGQAHVDIFSKTINIISGVAELFVGDPTKNTVLGKQFPMGGVTGAIGFYGNAELKVYDQSIYKKSYDKVYDPKLAWTGSSEYGTAWGTTYQFMVGPVPVNVSMSANIQLGMKYEAGLAPMKLYGRVVPRANAGASASAGVGIAGILEAGAAGSVNIIDLTVPLQGTAELKFASAGEPYIDVNITGDVDYKILNGEFYAYAVYYVPRWGIPPWKKKRPTKTLFSWAGTGASRNIFNWGMELGYKGVKLKGDAQDQGDLKQAEALAAAIALDERAKSMETYLNDTAARIMFVYVAIGNEASTKAITSDSSTVLATGALNRTNAVKELYKLCRVAALAAGRNDAACGSEVSAKNVNFADATVIVDTDKDGVSDDEERILGTNPNSADSDLDGIDDKYELSHAGFNPLLASDATLDFDNDGYTNLAEYKAGSDPTYAASNPVTLLNAAKMIPIWSLLLQ